ncbi:MAG: hypothetical protein MUF25_23375 [Pirellulaceae bacterium]|jgi:UDP-glucose 4-epimerase|nr:hypothetical protein [Pirellulaceae bacterium]
MSERLCLVTGGAGFINLANGRATDLLTLLAALNRLLQLNIQPRHEPPRVGDIRDRTADVTQARRLLGYEVQVDFEQGLQRSIDYYRAQAAG